MRVIDNRPVQNYMAFVSLAIPFFALCVPVLNVFVLSVTTIISLALLSLELFILQTIHPLPMIFISYLLFGLSISQIARIKGIHNV